MTRNGRNNGEGLTDLVSPNPTNFYVKFLIMGDNKAFCYKVSERDWNKLTEAFHEPPNASLDVFLSFRDIQHNILVYVNRDWVRLFQALFDSGTVESKPSVG